MNSKVIASFQCKAPTTREHRQRPHGAPIAYIKDNSKNYSEQISLFKNLKQLIEVKGKTAKEGVDGLFGYEDTNAQALLGL